MLQTKHPTWTISAEAYKVICYRPKKWTVCIEPALKLALRKTDS